MAERQRPEKAPAAPFWEEVEDDLIRPVVPSEHVQSVRASSGMPSPRRTLKSGSSEAVPKIEVDDLFNSDCLRTSPSDD